MACKEWIKTAISNHIRDICQKTSTSIWVDWINTYRLKGKCLWEMKASRQSSWNWKKTLKTDEFMKRRIKVIIGNVEKMLLWKENWNPFKLLLERYRRCISYDVSLDLN